LFDEEKTGDEKSRDTVPSVSLTESRRCSDSLSYSTGDNGGGL
jgi:hypothetical protein